MTIKQKDAVLFVDGHFALGDLDENLTVIGDPRPIDIAAYLGEDVMRVANRGPGLVRVTCGEGDGDVMKSGQTMLTRPKPVILEMICGESAEVEVNFFHFQKRH